MEPWGTPALTGNQLEFEPLITTLCSAVNQLINITNDFGKALDSGKEVRGRFLRYQ
jgi:hypothetical protein